MTIFLTIIYFLHARVQEIDQLYCEWLIKQPTQLIKDTQEQKTGVGAGAADGI